MPSLDKAGIKMSCTYFAKHAAVVPPWLFHFHIAIFFFCVCEDAFYRFFDICVCLDMGAVNINGFREKITAALYFKQNPRKNHLNNIFCKTMPEVITDCGKMGDRLVQWISGEPPVHNIHADFLRMRRSNGSPYRCWISTILNRTTGAILGRPLSAQ